jgi:arylsulfatase A-like enzyme
MGETASISRRELLKRGVDHACLLGGLGTLAAGLSCQKEDSDRLDSGVSPKKPPIQTIVLVTLDTTRADHLGCYGYNRPTSPNLDRIAEESLVYENMLAPGTWTLPSHASLFTGKFPSSHGARLDPKGELQLTSAISAPKVFDNYRVRTIAQDENTLADLLKRAGYLTGAVVAGPWMKKTFGLSKGFDFYDDSKITELNGCMAEDVTNQALTWLDRPTGKPRLLFLNYFDPHTPLLPPEEYAQKFVPSGARYRTDPEDPPLELETYIGLYDAEILYMDYHLGRLFDGLKERGLYDGAWIILTADHGHLLGEHGELGHGDVPYQPVLQIPLIVKNPGIQDKGGRVNTVVQLTDMLPMILDRLGQQSPAGIQGSVPPGIDHPLLSESRTLPPYYAKGSWLAIIDQGKKLIWNSLGNHLLFNLAEDPEEEHNLFARYPADARALGDAMHDYIAGLPEPGQQAPAGPVDDETLKALKSVGYLN